MEDLKLLLRMKKIPVWKVAEECEVSEMTIFRWLRKYNADHHEKIMQAINKIEGDADEQNNENV